MATFLNFDVGGRPYNSQDFASLQGQLVDTTRIYAAYNNGGNYVVEGCATRGASGTVWLDGKVRAVQADPSINGATPFPLWIIAQDNQISRVYADGQAKVAFNVFNGAWSTTPPGSGVAFIIFNSQADIDNTRLISFITPDAVPSTGGTFTGDISIIDSVRTIATSSGLGTTMFASTGTLGEFNTGIGFNHLWNGSNYINYGDGTNNVSGGITMKYQNAAAPVMNFFLNPTGGGANRFLSNLDVNNSVKMSLSSTGDLSVTNSITSPTAFHNNVTVTKSAGISTITFPAVTNDPGFIQHDESSPNVGIMRFSASDDFGSQDYFTFGAAPSGVYTEGVRMYTNGATTFKNNVTVQGTIDATVVIQNGTNLLSAVNTAQSTANTAQSTANTAQSTANTANSTANSASSAVSSLTGTVNTHTSQISDLYTKIIPSGVILLWSGSTGSIPAGWALCDGGGGRPNLRDRFIVGAGSSYSPGATGGNNTIFLSSSQLPPHTHTYNRFIEKSNDWKGDGSSSPGNGTGGINTSSTSTGSTGFGSGIDIRPLYYALAYIIKL